MSALQAIERRNPEWRPWLAVVREVLLEMDNPAWDAAVPPLPDEPQAGAPLLLGIDRFPEAELERLRGRLAARALPEAAIAALLPVPFLQACRRRWAGVLPRHWAHGYCPLCGAWPAFAEICGVERSRYLRCARCDSAWQAHGLWCAYCRATDHEALGSLVVEQSGASTAIDVCRACRGYLKAFTRLRLGVPGEALLEDLGSVELDLAAAERGYVRPQHPGYAPA